MGAQCAERTTTPRGTAKNQRTSPLTPGCTVSLSWRLGASASSPTTLPSLVLPCMWHMQRAWLGGRQAMQRATLAMEPCDQTDRPRRRERDVTCLTRYASRAYASGTSMVPSLICRHTRTAGVMASYRGRKGAREGRGMRTRMRICAIGVLAATKRPAHADQVQAWRTCLRLKDWDNGPLPASRAWSARTLFLHAASYALGKMPHGMTWHGRLCPTCRPRGSRLCKSRPCL